MLSAFRAPVDNDRKLLPRWTNVNTWEGENLNHTFSKIYDCRVENNRIIVKGSLAGVARKPFFRYSLSVSIASDGEITFSLEGEVHENTFWLPRLGMDFTLPGNDQDATVRKWDYTTAISTGNMSLMYVPMITEIIAGYTCCASGSWNLLPKRDLKWLSPNTARRNYIRRNIPMNFIRTE